ncbi:hypothetical protein [Akkermansia muciniphila]|uniref:hypothetical protein n=1 Tax=Akkermansia muciniphila TaxID=239935 RepID=UPI0029E81351|nr:hypothetical protein [Akkermansia muciniphila]WPK63916.1 hypothetical protein SBL66_08115 [Akkermansia muciniphila]
MLDFLGVTEHFSCMENTPFSFPALFRDMAGEAVSLDGVIFSGSIVSANQEVIEISIEKGESSNEVIFSFPALPEGRWSYNVLVQADDGSQRILFSGYISVLGVSRVAQLAGGPPMKNRTLLVAMPGEATMRLRMEWMATTAAQAFAYHALQASKNAHADAETASQAAKTATDAAATAATRTEEAEGYAGSAWASKRAAADSAAAADTSATNADRDAKSAHDAKTAVESLAATWPETVSNGEKKIVDAGNEAVTAIQDKQAAAVLAVGRASQTAQQNIASAQVAAVSAVQAAGKEAKETIEPLVQRAETAREDIDQAERRINTAATNATTSATSAANSATAAANALAAIPQVDDAGNMTLDGNITAAGGTFDGAINANGGINIPLAVGAATDASAVNRLYAAGLAAVTDAFSVRCYPLLADCSSSNGTVFKTDREPNSLYFNVPPHSAFTVKCGLATNARPMHNYSSIRGWVAPLRLPAVSTKFTARFGQMTTVARMGRDRDAFTLVPDQAAGGYKIGEIIDITFDHVRDADAGGYHIRVREIYYSNAEQKWKMKTTQALAPETSSNNGYPVCVYAVVYEQYQDGGYDTEDRGALWLLHGGNSSRGCVKIATVKGVHCFESIYPFSGYYLDMENTNSWALAGAFLPATMHLHCNNVNPAYYGFSSMESNIIVSEAVEDFVDPEAETTTED